MSFTIKRHVNCTLSVSDTPDKLTEDWEIQNWGHMLADPEDGLGIKVQFDRSCLMNGQTDRQTGSLHVAVYYFLTHEELRDGCTQANRLVGGQTDRPTDWLNGGWMQTNRQMDRPIN